MAAKRSYFAGTGVFFYKFYAISASTNMNNPRRSRGLLLSLGIFSVPEMCENGRERGYLGLALQHGLPLLLLELTGI
ncbi:MAG: hypothetical protein RSH26_05910, partial [Clostridia bacterium]